MAFEAPSLIPITDEGGRVFGYGVDSRGVETRAFRTPFKPEDLNRSSRVIGHGLEEILEVAEQARLIRSSGKLALGNEPCSLEEAGPQ